MPIPVSATEISIADCGTRKRVPGIAELNAEQVSSTECLAYSLERLTLTKGVVTLSANINTVNYLLNINEGFHSEIRNPKSEITRPGSINV